MAGVRDFWNRGPGTDRGVVTKTILRSHTYRCNYQGGYGPGSHRRRREGPMTTGVLWSSVKGSVVSVTVLVLTLGSIRDSS